MDKEQIKEMTEAIRSRTTISPVAVSLTKMLDAFDMGMFSQVCADRIAAENLINGENIDIRINVKSHVYDLTFDSTGLDICHDILAGYIDSDVLEYYKNYLERHNSIIGVVNKEITAFRNADTLSLFKMLINPSKYIDDNRLADEVSQIARAELQARSPLNRVRVLVTDFINKSVHYVKSYPIIKLAKKTVKDCERETKKENLQ
jgi:hypothetical protein